MLMQRLQTNNNNSTTPPDTKPIPSHTNIIKMRLLGKDATSMRQQNHVKSLITTAATGTGLINDVDALLTPLVAANQNDSSSSASSSNGAVGGNTSGSGSGNGSGSTQRIRNDSSRPERNLWSKREMMEMLEIMHETNALDKLNVKAIKSDKVFRKIEELMNEKGLCKKSHVQIWTKWKFLKSTYNTTRRNGTIPKMIPGEVYQMLCKMLDGNNGSIGGSDCGNSVHSAMDGETSNGEIADTSNEITNSFDYINKTAVENEEENDLSIAHPIFGNRLGPIKPEPADTGYETVGNNDISSDQDPLENISNGKSNAIFDHTPFPVDVKQELDDDTPNTPPPTAPASPTPTSAGHNLNSQMNFEQNSFNGKQTIVTSTPQNLQLPPLRVAPFAKESTTSGVLKIEHQPTYSASSSMRHLRPNNVSNTNNATQSMARLMLPKIPAPTSSTSSSQYAYMRLPKDITVQTTRTSTNMLRLKQVPMRKTPYSLRPERLIPDLDQSISPPPSPVSANATILQQHQKQTREPLAYPTFIAGNSATTSRQAQYNGKERKRRLPFDMPTSIQYKLPRNPVTSGTYKPATDFSSCNSNADDDDDEDEDDDNSDISLGDIGAETKSSKQHKKNKILESQLEALADALRQAQSEMMRDFFAHQKEIARREHEFQLKQDAQIMRAFRKQTEQLFESAKSYLNIDLTTDERKKPKLKKHSGKHVQQAETETVADNLNSEQHSTTTIGKNKNVHNEYIVGKIEKDLSLRDAENGEQDTDSEQDAPHEDVSVPNELAPIEFVGQN